MDASDQPHRRLKRRSYHSGSEAPCGPRKRVRVRRRRVHDVEQPNSAPHRRRRRHVAPAVPAPPPAPPAPTILDKLRSKLSGPSEKPRVISNVAEHPAFLNTEPQLDDMRAYDQHVLDGGSHRLLRLRGFADTSLDEATVDDASPRQASPRAMGSPKSAGAKPTSRRVYSGIPATDTPRLTRNGIQMPRTIAVSDTASEACPPATDLANDVSGTLDRMTRGPSHGTVGAVPPGPVPATVVRSPSSVNAKQPSVSPAARAASEGIVRKSPSSAARARSAAASTPAPANGKGGWSESVSYSYAYSYTQSYSYTPDAEKP